MCTRVFWNDNGQAMVVGRTMDWPDSTMPVLTVLPRGMTRQGGNVGPEQFVKDNPLTWSSKYGSLITSIYGIGTADGVNERGLAVHLLYLENTRFEDRDPSLPGLQASLWGQYLLDNAATVQEAVDLLGTFQLVMMEAHGHQATVHLSLEDAGGDSAIIEYQNGVRTVHHNREFQVQTNEPPFQEQLDLLARQDFSNPSDSMPLAGNISPIDRFQRAVYFTDLLPDPKTDREAVAGVMSVMRNVSIPFGAPYEGFGTYNTEYRTIADLTNMRYFFELSTSPNVIWVDLQNLDFSPGAPVMLLDPDSIDLAGEVSGEFEAGEAPF